MFAPLLLAVPALASPVSSDGLPTFVQDLQRDHGCVVVLGVPKESAGDARDVLETVARVRAVKPEDWDEIGRAHV